VENVHVIDEERIARQGIAPAQLGEISSIMSAVGAANSIGIRPGETVMVMPATGFFSSSAVVAALGLGTDVVAVSRSRETLDAMIKAFGENGKRISPVVITGDVERDAAALRAATPGGKGADAYIDFSSPAAAEGTHVQAGLLALKRHGRWVTYFFILPHETLYKEDSWLTTSRLSVLQLLFRRCGTRQPATALHGHQAQLPDHPGLVCSESSGCGGYHPAY
jgi:NADPH:quinone reductase-like Zn-dependent oxidoreductase